jgi:hypothetical protein
MLMSTSTPSIKTANRNQLLLLQSCRGLRDAAQCTAKEVSAKHRLCVLNATEEYRGHRTRHDVELISWRLPGAGITGAAFRPHPVRLRWRVFANLLQSA